MPVVKSMDELKKLLRRKLQSAMAEAKLNADKAVQSAVDQFYASSPQKYVRTGTLAESIRVSDVQNDGDSFSITADVNPTPYPTGSHPTAQTVVGWASSGAAGIRGHLDWQETGETLKRIVQESVENHL